MATQSDRPALAAMSSDCGPSDVPQPSSLRCSTPSGRPYACLPLRKGDANASSGSVHRLKKLVASLERTHQPAVVLGRVAVTAAPSTARFAATGLCSRRPLCSERGE